ncbi:toll-like receptor 3 [Lytechinus variegatus]|uniref:toll-like receptor 3 n=1 Tax=Lytechinus variegatus TaxID=7654 RepID=UPI001BB2B609|nr:toll-like receptor 3 [Lytechinus variegatus]
MEVSHILHFLLLGFSSLFVRHVDAHVGFEATTSSTLLTSKSTHGCNQDMDFRMVDCSHRDLKEVPQDLSKDIVLLDLSNNRIKMLLNSSFDVYPLITSLYISNNDLGVIESTSFHPLHGLKILNLSCNPRLVLPVKDVFKMSPQLITLYLEEANLMTLPNDTLQSSQNLHRLLLSKNKLSFINISSCGKVDKVYMDGNQIQRIAKGWFTFVCHSDFLDLTDNPIQFVDPDDFASLNIRSLKLGFYPLSEEVLINTTLGISKSNLQELTIVRGYSGAFPEGLFDPLCNSSLSVLNFYGNELTYLPPLVFANLTKLKQFTFSYNSLPIDIIPPEIFNGMESLDVLNISNNDITEINPDNQTWTLVNLTQLNLRENSLTKILSSTFRGLESLISLDMNSNKELSFLELNAFSGLSSIQYIDLSGTNVYDLQLNIPTLRILSLNFILESPNWTPSRSPFRYLQSLVDFSLRKSSIFIVHLFSNATNASLFDGLLNLHRLDLSGNYFDGTKFFDNTLPPGIFRQLFALQELIIDDCKIENVHPHFFTGLESLQTLSLKGNNIKSLDGRLLWILPQLGSINLGGNQISYLERLIFLKNAKLTKLSLADNKLTSLNQSAFKPIASSISLLDLSNNPIACNCDIQWLIDLLNENIDLDNKDNTICTIASIEPLRLKHLLDFDPNQFCTGNIGLISLISLTIVCFIVISIITYHNRWYLKYKIFLLKLAAVGYREMQDAREHDDYEFDLNIIFYDDDEVWVREHFRPALVEHLPQFRRNVFGDEDLVLGMHYLDAVDYVVTHSYKTIIVLSKAAVKDRWFVLKFRTAMDHVSDTLTEFVMVVFLEDIHDDEMPFLVRLYLRDGRPYIHWTEDVRGQEYFWNKLTKYLTINLRTNDILPNE